MGTQRRQRRANERAKMEVTTVLACLLGDFYEFLSKTPKPLDEEVRAEFIQSDKKWRKYCHSNKLINMNHLFAMNVREAWNRHRVKEEEK